MVFKLVGKWMIHNLLNFKSYSDDGTFPANRYRALNAKLRAKRQPPPDLDMIRLMRVAESLDWTGIQGPPKKNRYIPTLPSIPE
uniref:Transposase n=1 Tax=Steinernema glaseri TaxID=37863 RepID=A0A1I7YFW5_9BILA